MHAPPSSSHEAPDTTSLQNRIIAHRNIQGRQLTPHPLNPAIHSDIQKDKLRKTLARIGVARTILVYDSPSLGENVIIDGHMRAGEYKDTLWPCTVLDVSDDEAKVLIAALDTIAGERETDDASLVMLLSSILEDTGTLEGTAHTSDDLNTLLDSLAPPILPEEFEEGHAPLGRADELAILWGTERGQLWQAGPHRILCGDSTDPDDLARLFDGRLADLCVTDPPYGVSYGAKQAQMNGLRGASSITTPIEGDNGTVEETKALWDACFPLIFKHLKEGGCYYMSGPQGGELMHAMLSSVYESGLLLKHQIIWVKNHFVLGRADYHYQHEPILYGWKPGAAHYFGGPTNECSVWNYDKPITSKLHPTMKPIPLFARCIVNGARRDEIVFDPFLGSGTTALAAHETGRICYGIELTPEYTAVTLERLKQAGLTPTLISCTDEEEEGDPSSPSPIPSTSLIEDTAEKEAPAI